MVKPGLLLVRGDGIMFSLTAQFMIYADKMNVFIPKNRIQYSLKRNTGEEKETATVAADFTDLHKGVTEG